MCDYVFTRSGKVKRLVYRVGFGKLYIAVQGIFNAMGLGVRYLSIVASLCGTMMWAGMAHTEMLPGRLVVIQGLDKVTARISTFDANINEVVRFGALRIIARKCERTPPEDPPESSAFLNIFEERPGEVMAEVFQGWMFASSPALSALEHPVYDVWVLECKLGTVIVNDN